jgi:hypothetical protein
MPIVPIDLFAYYGLYNRNDRLSHKVVMYGPMRKHTLFVVVAQIGAIETGTIQFVSIEVSCDIPLQDIEWEEFIN